MGPQKLVLYLSAPARQLANELEHRFETEAIAGSLPVLAECPSSDCVGVGLLGYGVVSCTCCGRQWSAEHNEKIEDALNQILERLVDGIKRCPKCRVAIEKNGGCNHMTCKSCKHEFFWDTLAPYRLH